MSSHPSKPSHNPLQSINNISSTSMTHINPHPEHLWPTYPPSLTYHSCYTHHNIQPLLLQSQQPITRTSTIQTQNKEKKQKITYSTVNSHTSFQVFTSKQPNHLCITHDPQAASWPLLYRPHLLDSNPPKSPAIDRRNQNPRIPQPRAKQPTHHLWPPSTPQSTHPLPQKSRHELENSLAATKIAILTS